MDKLKQQIKTHYDSITPSEEFLNSLAAMEPPTHRRRGYLFAIAAMLALIAGATLLCQHICTPKLREPAPITMQQTPIKAAPTPIPDAAPKKPEAPAKPAQKPAAAAPEQPEAPVAVSPAPAAPAEAPAAKPSAPAAPVTSDPAEPIPETPTEPVPVEPPEIDDPPEIVEPPDDTGESSGDIGQPEQSPRTDLQATYSGGIVTLTNAAGEQATIDVSEQFNQRTYYGVFTVFGEQIDIFLYPDESSETAVLAGYLDEPLKK